MTKGSEPPLNPQAAFALRALDPKLSKHAPTLERLPDGRMVAVITRIDQGFAIMGCAELVRLLGEASVALHNAGELIAPEHRGTVRRIDDWLRHVEPFASEVINAPAVH